MVLAVTAQQNHCLLVSWQPVECQQVQGFNKGKGLPPPGPMLSLSAAVEVNESVVRYLLFFILFFF